MTKSQKRHTFFPLWFDQNFFDTIINTMTSVEKIIKKMKQNPKGVRFTDLKKVCDTLFGEPRSQGTSHHVYKTPWEGKPYVNIQDKNGKAKPYQVKQVLEAIAKNERNTK